MTPPLFVARAFVVRTYDVDFASIVHNLVYIRWLEDLRLDLLQPHLPMEQMLHSGYSPILTHTEIDYIHPISLGDPVHGKMWVSELGRTRWALQAEFKTGDTLASRATQRGYFADLQTLRPVRAPERLQALWQKTDGNASPST
jgi:acyl-CoA thioester hydrolase